jgi:hypothetical protein
MLALAIALALSIGVETSMPIAAHFPNVSGSNLNGKAFTLPHDLAAPLNLVLVAYQRDQQAAVDTWHEAGARARQAGVAVWEVPTLSRGSALFRGFIDGGMRRGIPDPNVRAATITLYIDKRAFNSALNVVGESTITVLLVRPSGEIVWRTTGPYTAEAGAALQAVLDDGRARS